MSNNKIHSHGNVPFSWETKPGVSKITSQDRGHREIAIKLPPPPCKEESIARAAEFHDLKIPLPPCAFHQPVLRSTSSRRSGVKEKDDPFLMAYKECTKSTRKGKFSRISKDDAGIGLRKKTMSIFSCENSCSVREDGIVRVSQLSISKYERERDGFIPDG